MGLEAPSTSISMGMRRVMREDSRRFWELSVTFIPAAIRCVGRTLHSSSARRVDQGAPKDKCGWMDFLLYGKPPLDAYPAGRQNCVLDAIPPHFGCALSPLGELQC